MEEIFASGFTFVRNIEKMDYPVIESISSVLPILDEFVVVVSESQDKTAEIIEEFSHKEKKIKIIKSRWNPNMNFGGFAYAQQTNIGLFNCKGK